MHASGIQSRRRPRSGARCAAPGPRLSRRPPAARRRGAAVWPPEPRRGRRAPGPRRACRPRRTPLIPRGLARRDRPPPQPRSIRPTRRRAPRVEAKRRRVRRGSNHVTHLRRREPSKVTAGARRTGRRTLSARRPPAAGSHPMSATVRRVGRDTKRGQFTPGTCTLDWCSSMATLVKRVTVVTARSLGAPCAVLAAGSKQRPLEAGQDESEARSTRRRRARPSVPHSPPSVPALTTPVCRTPAPGRASCSSVRARSAE